MKMKSLFLSLLALFIFSTNVWAEKKFNETQIKEIEGILHDYLVTNPEILIEASRALQEKQQQEMLARAQEAIPEHQTKLFKSSSSPVLGNKKGQVYIVEFLDYSCGHCRQMYSVLKKLIAEDSTIKLVVKEFPIFGGVSDYAAKMALASEKQGKYGPFHAKLMEIKPPLTKVKIKNIAKALKLNVKRLEKDMDSDAINQELRNNLELAQSLGIVGTPAYVVAGGVGTSNLKSFFVPGASTLDMLQSLVAKATK